MTQQKKQSSISLLSLPQLPLQAVIKCLGAKDKQSLVGTCRHLAAAVSAVSSKTQSTLTSSAGWQGLSKARPLRSLLPVNLASCLPDLEELEIEYSDGQCVDNDDDLQPLPYCSSLRKLSYIGTKLYHEAVQLPSKYHTSTELQSQLPNIVSLKLLPSWTQSATDNQRFMRCVETMLEAWGSQLTELELKTDMLPPQLQRCTRLQSLKWHRHHFVADKVVLMTDLPCSLTSLTSLTLDNDSTTERQLQAILQLPVLRVFSPAWVSNLRQDWCQHPCTWQQLNMTSISMLQLSKLPLHSLKCLDVQGLQLPDPLLPDSLNVVTCVAQHLSSANTMIEGFKCWSCEQWKPGSTCEGINCPDSMTVDTASAELLLHTASRVVQPPEVYTYYDIGPYPRTHTIICRWLSPKLRELHFTKNEDTLQPWVWQALECCGSLTTTLKPFWDDTCSAEIVATASILVLQVAEHLVAVTRRPLKLVMSKDQGCVFSYDVAYRLTGKLHKELPASVSLQGCAMESDSKLVIQLKAAN